MLKVVLAAGGSGSRLYPMTKWVNKHLAPCGDGTLMIDYPLAFLSKSGFGDVTIVTGSNHATQIVEYVGDGSSYGLKVDYSFQPKPAGIADVLNRISSRHVTGVILLLADNFFSKPQCFKNLAYYQAKGWEYDIGSSEKASAFGQAMRGEDGSVFSIVEKPKNPVHSKILTGLYYFPGDVFDRVERMTPSARNELEITGLMEMYLKDKALEINQVEGMWKDLGEWNPWQEFVGSRSGCEADYYSLISSRRG